MGKKNNILPLLALLLLPVSGPASADWFLDLGTEVLHDDNLTLGELGSDIRSDTSLSASAELGYFTQIADFTGLTLFATYSKSVFETYSGLNKHSLGGGIAINHKFGVGPRVPRLSFTLSASEADHNQQVRDSALYSTALSLDKRFSDSLEMSAGFTFDSRDGDFASFDTEGWSLFGNAWLDLGALSWVSTRYEYRVGEVTSSGRPSMRLWQAADGIADADPSFGTPLLIAYPIDADVHTLAVDWNRAVLDNGTFYLGVEHRRAFGDKDIDYDATLLRSGFLYRLDL